MKKEFARWQANFGTGLAVILPVVISIYILSLLFDGVSDITDKLLFPLKYFLDPSQIYLNGRDDKVFWYWSLLALMVAVFLIGLLGGLARHYLGKKLIQLMDYTMLKVPLLNRIYGAIKQVNDAFTTNNRSTFKQVVMVEFPKPGIWSIGFITGEQHPEVSHHLEEKIVSLFVPTTPNPTTGFLVLVPESKVIKLRMSVADGVKYIMSLGSVAPTFPPSLSAASLPPPPAPTTLSQTVPPPPDQVQAGS